MVPEELMRRKDWRVARIYQSLHLAIDQSTIKPDVFLGVGVGSTHEASYFQDKFAGLRIIGIDPCAKVHGFPGEYYKFAVSDHDGTTLFYHRPGKPDASSVYPRADGRRHRRIEVKCHTLDAFAKQNKVQGNLILWMDCEGSEVNALRGGAAVIDKVKWLYVENRWAQNHDGWPKEDVAKKIIDEAGFELFGEPNSKDLVFVKSGVLKEPKT